MTDKDDQELDEKPLDISGDALSSPPFDYGDLKGTDETAENFESTRPETEEPDDSDAVDIIDLSDEEVQQEFEEMEREEREVAKDPEASKEAEFTALEVDEEIQAEPVESSTAKTEEMVKKDNNSTVDTEKAPGSGKTDKLDTGSGSGYGALVNELLSRKIIYGSVAAALSVSAIVMVLIFSLDSEELASDATASTDEEPFPFVSREPIIEAAQAPDEEEIAEEEIVEEMNVEEEIAGELQVVEAENPGIDEQADTSLAPEVEISVAETEIPEEDSRFTEEVSVAPEETSAAIEVAENDAEEAPVAAEEAAVIPEELPTVAEEESATVAEVTSEVIPVVREESSLVSAQIAADLVTLNESTNNFYIIVASFNNSEMALKHASTLPENEESAIIIPPVEQNGKYRVAIAGYETMAAAQANISKYKPVYGDDIWPLKYTLTNKATLLNERTGNTYVVVSSFLTESSAQNHVNTLAAAGVEPSIIPPFGSSKSYRVSIFNYETLAAAQQALPQHKEEYGNDIWLLKY